MPPIILAFPENQTRIKLSSELDHVGPFPIVEARCSFLTSHWGYWGAQKSSDKSCFVIHRKDVNAPNHRENAKTIAHGGGSQCRLRVRAKVTQNPTSYKLPFKKGRPCPQPHKATDNWCSKVLGFFYQLHEMRIVGLHSQRVLGFRCSKMFKVTSLDSKKT